MMTNQSTEKNSPLKTWRINYFIYISRCNKALLICFCMLCAATITNAQEKNNVTFKLENGGADTVLIGYTSESDKALDEFIDTAVLKNGMLQYNMKFKGFIRGVIIPFSLMERFKSGVRLPAGRIEFYMNEGDEMVIDARNSPQGLKYTVTGNTISQQMAHYNNLYAQRSQEAMDRDRAYYDIKASERTPEINEAYLANRRKMNLVRENRTLQYARSNPGLEYTARQLLSVSNKDSVLSVFPLLTQNVRDSFFGKILTGMVNGWFTSVEGKQLPDFEAVTITGQKFKLSAQKAKFVLLDFWGSWCTPCLAEAPEMRALATEYKDKLQ
ncbi:MAG: TlpA family protein disulfide reductase, partial [Pedobacter sp.]